MMDDEEDDDDDDKRADGKKDNVDPCHDSVEISYLHEHPFPRPDILLCAQVRLGQNKHGLTDSSSEAVPRLGTIH